MRVFFGIIVALWALCWASLAQADILQPPAIPDDIEPSAVNSLADERAGLVGRLEQVLVSVRGHNSQCNNVRSDDRGAIAACQASQASVVSVITSYNAAVEAYDARLRAAPRRTRVYHRVGSGLVGGTGWQLGYYSPEGASAEVRERARALVREQARFAGARYDEQIDFDRYNFVIGIANETSFFRDLSSRVMFEQLLNGHFTQRYQEAYNLLRGRQFDELGCHSNGAMLCLAALMNRDILADDVVLYGPQITVESLRLWSQLLAEGRVHSVHFVLSENDPVPPASLLATPAQLTSVFSQALHAPLFFRTGSLASAVGFLTPGATVSTIPCGANESLPSMSCHDMRYYANARRPCPEGPTHARVPDTVLPGGRGVPEPPSNCPN